MALFNVAPETMRPASLMTKPVTFPAMLPYWIVTAILGGLIGSELGRRRLTNPTLRRLLAAVLVIAGLKLILT
jgi:uncharacterized membrane protein YfcA